MNAELSQEIASTAARMVVEQGLEWGAAKKRAVRQMGLPARTPLPDNDTLDAAVRDYIALFCAGTQPAELRALRALALAWMERMQAFRPYLCGAVWHGTATRLSDIDIQLFCDDPKSAEIALIDHKVRYEVGSLSGMRGSRAGRVDVLSVRSHCQPLGEDVGVHFRVHDADDLRGALKPDARGRAGRGDITAVRRLLEAAP